MIFFECSRSSLVITFTLLSGHWGQELHAHVFLGNMSILCLPDNRISRSRVVRQHIMRWPSHGPSCSPTLDPMAFEKPRVSTGDMRTNEGPAHPSGISNPGPMGLFAFASTTFILSMFNVQTRGITVPNVVVGMAIFAGGLTQFIAGMWEFPHGNVFGATVFSSYGAFWMSYATISIPASGIMSAYSDPDELASALGIYLVAWLMLTLFFLLAVLRRSIAYTALLASLSVAFACLAAAQFSGSVMVTKAGGAFGIITAFITYYIGVSEMLGAERRAVMRLPLGMLS
ncbi:GPR1/FUN34/yaaH family-domain-containing protein [Mycena sp. CBHHK59/15]|nr:GPR1/FUN34/yaaH family-domain-containing protein [Mycena sp. CBHHK59/15]